MALDTMMMNTAYRVRMFALRLFSFDLNRKLIFFSLVESDTAITKTFVHHKLLS